MVVEPSIGQVRPAAPPPCERSSSRAHFFYRRKRGGILAASYFAAPRDSAPIVRKNLLNVKVSPPPLSPKRRRRRRVLRSILCQLFINGRIREISTTTGSDYVAARNFCPRGVQFRNDRDASGEPSDTKPIADPEPHHRLRHQHRIERGSNRVGGRNAIRRDVILAACPWLTWWSDAAIY